MVSHNFNDSVKDRYMLDNMVRNYAIKASFLEKRPRVGCRVSFLKPYNFLFILTQASYDRT